MTCTGCDEPISPKRLKALVSLYGQLPEFPRCVRCQSEIDELVHPDDPKLAYGMAICGENVDWN